MISENTMIDLDSDTLEWWLMILMKIKTYTNFPATRKGGFITNNIRHKHFRYKLLYVTG